MYQMIVQKFVFKNEQFIVLSKNIGERDNFYRICNLTQTIYS